MILFDGVVLGIVFISLLLGALRGFTRELLSLLSWAGAALSSVVLLPNVQPFCSRFISNPWLSLIIAGGAVFLVLIIIFLLLSDGIVGYIKSTCLSGVDRIFGSLFGIARGGLFVCLAFWLCVFFIPQSQMNPFTQDSLLKPFVESTASFLKNTFSSMAVTEMTIHFLQRELGPLMETSLLSKAPSEEATTSHPTFSQSSPFLLPETLT